MIMGEERRMKRWQLVYYLRVFELGTDKLMGHLADITMDGMRLVSVEPIVVEKDYHLWMEVVKERIILVAKSKWTQQEEASMLYNTGFKLVNPTRMTINNIACLIEALRFQK